MIACLRVSREKHPPRKEYIFVWRLTVPLSITILKPWGEEFMRDEAWGQSRGAQARRGLSQREQGCWRKIKCMKLRWCQLRFEVRPGMVRGILGVFPMRSKLQRLHCPVCSGGGLIRYGGSPAVPNPSECKAMDIVKFGWVRHRRGRPGAEPVEQKAHESRPPGG
jgi:hypothetical protein